MERRQRSDCSKTRPERLCIGATPTSALGPARFREPFPRSTRPVRRSLTAMASGTPPSAARVRGQQGYQTNRYEDLRFTYTGDTGRGHPEAASDVCRDGLPHEQPARRALVAPPNSRTGLAEWLAAPGGPWLRCRRYDLAEISGDLTTWTMPSQGTKNGVPMWCC